MSTNVDRDEMNRLSQERNLEQLLGFPQSQMEARIIVGDPKAIAYKWMSGYLANLNSMVDGEGSDITMTELLETGISHLEGGYGEYITRGDAFESFSLDMTYWDKFSILFDYEVPTEQRSSFFSCSC